MALAFVLSTGCSSPAPAVTDAAVADSAILDAAIVDTETSSDAATDTSPVEASADAADDAVLDSGDGLLHYNPTVFAIVSKHCTTPGCHMGTTPPASLGLDDAKKGYDELLAGSSVSGMKLVVPLHPEKSALVPKLAHVPPGPSATEIATIKSWIETGAVY